MRDGAFYDPFVLKSEHKRVLETAQVRYDEGVKAAERIGYWRGIGQTVWISGFAALFAAIAGFNAALWCVQ